MLRQQQDEAYLASLRADQEKERKKREEQEQRRQEEEKVRQSALAEERRRRVSCSPLSVGFMTDDAQRNLLLAVLFMTFFFFCRLTADT